MVTCPNCDTDFEYTDEPEVAMGAVACPNCGAILNQNGDVVG